MTKNIFKGMHYSLDFLNCMPYFNFKSYAWFDKFLDVEFTNDSKYDIDVDQSDINKLFGISYGFHHNQSDRIGWRYNKDKDMFDIFLYSYENDNGNVNRVKVFICAVKANEKLAIRFRTAEASYYRVVNVDVYNEKIKQNYRLDYMFKHEHTWFGYNLGLYFGGNRKAPKNIKINIH